MTIVIEFGPKITTHRLSEDKFHSHYESLFQQGFDPDEAIAFHQYATEKVWLLPNNISVVRGLGGYDIYVLCQEIVAPKHSLKEDEG